MSSKIIYLIGARASGKSTVGKALAEQLDWAFIDTDLCIEHEQACSIAELVNKKGWDFFRQCESAVLQKNTADNTVIATGGGMVLAEQNRKFMLTHGKVFFLSLPEAILIQRLENDNNKRPALTTKGTVNEVALVLLQRLPLYKSTAHHEIDASQSIIEIVQKIITYNA